ncbi:MAG: prepilin-type N-terminal cleavage/methylation domain-containing protein [Candidatus Acidiferrales bacterium]
MSQSPQSKTEPGAKQRRGFSLIELLIVVAIILIIAAIAIPNLLRARIAANQADAVENCRTITSAEVIYYTTYAVGFAPSLSALESSGSGNPTVLAAGLIDEVLGSGTKTGYIFTYAPLSPDASGHPQDYQLNADPVLQAVTGHAHYFTNEPSVIRFNMSAKASSSDPALQ